MLRSLIRLHTWILATASAALLVAPVGVLAAFGVAGPSFEMFALTRVFAGVLVVLAVAMLPIPELPARIRGRALTGVAAAYALLAAVALGQQVAIWSSVAGMLLTTACFLYAAAFAWVARAEHARRLAGV
jgi:hypothetical protein